MKGVQLEERETGVILPIRAQAGAKRNAVLGSREGMLRVAVTQAPEKGKANQAIIQTVCKALGLRKSQVELIAGPTSPLKRFLITGIDLQDLRRRIEEHS